jgi:hypothetical protein
MWKSRNVLSFEIVVTLSLALMLAGGSSFAAEEGEKKAGAKAQADGSKEAAESFSVLQVGEKVSVVKSSEVAAFRKKVSDEYDASLKAYNEAKQKAAKAKKKFDSEKPAKPLVKTVASALKTEESARAVQQKTVAQIAERKKKEKERKEKERERAKNGK